VLERSLKAAVKSCDIELARGNLFAGTDKKGISAGEAYHQAFKLE